MSNKNFFHRTMDAIVEGRTREAQRYVQRYLREHAPLDRTSQTKR